MTNQKAELEAVIRALVIVRSQVMPRRREFCRRAPGSKSAVRDATHLRVVVATDSSYVVEGLCQHWSGWNIDPRTDQFRNKKGKVVGNSDGFLGVRRAVEALSMVGAQVAYYHVPREHNTEADRLAKKATGT